MRAIWKGAVSFGLVSVPVQVHSATEDHVPDLHQVHDADGGRIRYQRRCEVCGRQVAYEHIDKAYEHGDRTVILTDDDLSSLPEESSREIEVLEFVPTDQIDPIMFERTYYLAPAADGLKPYTLLRRALEDTELTAVVRFTLRQRTRLGALRVRGKVLLLQRLRWAEEVREPEFEALDKDVRLGAKEREMAANLVRSLESDFEPEQYDDAYADQLKELVEAKLSEGETVDTDATFGATDGADDAEVVDLMDALRQSVDRAKQSGRKKRGTQASTSGAKKATPKKSTRKKSASKKKAAG